VCLIVERIVAPCGLHLNPNDNGDLAPAHRNAPANSHIDTYPHAADFYTLPDANPDQLAADRHHHPGRANANPAACLDAELPACRQPASNRQCN
jgi:hypothetical protein